MHLHSRPLKTTVLSVRTCVSARACLSARTGLSVRAGLPVASRATSVASPIAMWLTLLVVAFGCSKPSTNEQPVVVAAPPSASAQPLPRVKAEIFAARSSAMGGSALQVATRLSFTPKNCDPSQYLGSAEPPGSQPTSAETGAASAEAGAKRVRRRMVLFRVKNVVLESGGQRVVASQGGETAEDTHPKEEGEHAIVIDCFDDVPNGDPFPFVFLFNLPEGFDEEHAFLEIEGQRLPLASFVKAP